MFCSQCGVQNAAGATCCANCGMVLVEIVPEYRAPDIGQDAGIRMLLPVGRSGYAIIAGYLGLMSPLCVFAPFALLFGILAVRDIRRHPDRHGLGRAWFGIVMGGLGTAALLFVLCGLGIEAIMGRR